MGEIFDNFTYLKPQKLLEPVKIEKVWGLSGNNREGLGFVR
jgi:hypothetical protein